MNDSSANTNSDTLEREPSGERDLSLSDCQIQGQRAGGSDSPCDDTTDRKENRPAHQSYYWSDQEDDRLRKLAGNGLTASAIGHALGRSRSAVTGRASRLGVTIGGGKSIAVADNRQQGGIRGGSVKKMQNNAAWRAQRKSNRVAKYPRGDVNAAPIPAAAPRMLALVDLGADDCRFPLGDPKDEEFGFCGCERRPGSRYCDHHHHICHGGQLVEEGV